MSTGPMLRFHSKSLSKACSFQQAGPGDQGLDTRGKVSTIVPGAVVVAIMNNEMRQSRRFWDRLFLWIVDGPGKGLEESLKLLASVHPTERRPIDLYSSPNQNIRNNHNEYIDHIGIQYKLHSKLYTICLRPWLLQHICCCIPFLVCVSPRHHVLQLPHHQRGCHVSLHPFCEWPLQILCQECMIMRSIIILVTICAHSLRHYTTRTVDTMYGSSLFYDILSVSYAS